jgi:peptidoglycan/LPS O-acetylase OafA/YrhL
MIRLLNWQHYNRDMFNYQTQVRADALLIGCLLALILHEERYRSLILRCSKFCVLPCAATLFLCIAHFHWLAPSYESIAIAGLLAYSVYHPQQVFSRVLSFKPLVWLGTISYSAYIWQEFFTYLPWPGSWQPGLFLLAFPLITLFSFYCIERPSTRLGHRLTMKPSNP